LRRAPGFRLLLVDAEPEVRFARAARRGRVGDAATLEAFLELEDRENLADPTGQQLRATAALADETLRNEGDLAALHAALERLLGN